MIFFAALISSIFFSIFLAVLVFGRSEGEISVVFWVASVSVIYLLIRSYFILSKVHLIRASRTRYIIRSYVELHIFPITYFFFQFVGVRCLPPFEERILMIMFLLFFFTGRMLWYNLSCIFTSIMYKLFYRGHSGMCFSLSILFMLAIYFEKSAGADFYQRLMQFYFGFHFFLVGPAIVKIEHDVNKVVVE